VRCDDYTRVGEQGVVLRQRLRVGYVESGAE
jgi:hypothetical protein